MPYRLAISLSGVNDGTRTHDNQCHKLALYQLNYVHHMERVVGIEPTFPAWKAGVLPIYDTRIFGAKDGTRTRNIHLGKVALYH